MVVVSGYVVARHYHMRVFTGMLPILLATLPYAYRIQYDNAYRISCALILHCLVLWSGLHHHAMCVGFTSYNNLVRGIRSKGQAVV